jgi:hypothetical protein
MNKPISLTALLLLMASVSAVAQSAPAAPIQAPSAPVGAPPLSAPKAIDQDAALAGRLPYGAGFENRQQARANGGGARGGAQGGAHGGSGRRR